MTWAMIVGISSIIIALCALGISIWQAILTRKHNKLSFKPHLTSWTHKNTQKGFYAIEIINNGLGPAIIESFSVKVDDKRIAGEGTEPIQKALKILFPNYSYDGRISKK